MLQYALLHLFGYKLSLQDLKDFRVSIFTDTLFTYTTLANPFV